MNFIFDAHIHLYPCYDLGVALDGLWRRLERLAPGAVKAGVLAERQGQHVCRDWQAGAELAGGIDITPLAGGDGVGVRFPDGRDLMLFAGRQAVARERIEVLALTRDLDLADGAPAATLIEQVLTADAVPVVTWAVGKWLGARGAVVNALVDRFGKQLLLGDSSLRCRGWPEPGPFGRLAALGGAVLAGSDPLPFAADATVMGTYATGAEMPARTALDLRHLLRAADAAALRRTGRRSTVAGMIRRLICYYRGGGTGGQP